MELIFQKKLNGKKAPRHCTNLKEDVGWEAKRLDGPVGDLVEHRLGLVVLGQIDRRVSGVRLPWLRTKPINHSQLALQAKEQRPSLSHEPISRSILRRDEPKWQN
jgi:hypothetical protein